MCTIDQTMLLSKSKTSEVTELSVQPGQTKLSILNLATHCLVWGGLFAFFVCFFSFKHIINFCYFHFYIKVVNQISYKLKKAGICTEMLQGCRCQHLF